MRVVYEAAHVIDAHLVRHALEAAGMHVFVRGEALLGGLGELGVFGLVQVCVLETDWAQARAVVEGLALSVASGDAPEVPPLPLPGLAT
jgi:hypothetical protein